MANKSHYKNRLEFNKFSFPLTDDLSATVWGMSKEDRRFLIELLSSEKLSFGVHVEVVQPVFVWEVAHIKVSFVSGELDLSKDNSFSCWLAGAAAGSDLLEDFARKINEDNDQNG